MPATSAEIGAWVRALVEQAVMPDDEPVWADGTRATEQEQRDIWALACYEIRMRLRVGSPKATRRAYRLLRRFLTPSQQAELTRTRMFTVVGRSGRLYRLAPATGTVYEVERHGKHCFIIRSFCVHPDDAVILPLADTTVAQLLLLSSDEDEFLRVAIAKDRRSDQLWNGEWMRRLRQARLERARAQP